MICKYEKFFIFAENRWNISPYIGQRLGETEMLFFKGTFLSCFHDS